jgi:copper homeostasis protein
MKKTILEIACFNLESALIAQDAGASRIEFCEDYTVGGVTPSSSLIKQIKEQISIPVFVMIRPRSGDFHYSEEEFKLMKQQIEFCKQNNMDGVVFGILTKDKKIDEPRCQELVRLAQPMSCTFHRAFDETIHPFDALETIIRCGFHRVLTSGQKATAAEGAENIKQLMEQAKNRIIILPGGGIRPENISLIQSITQAKEFHSAALAKNETIANLDLILALLQQMVGAKQ